MDRTTSLGILLIGLATFAGCGDSATPESASTDNAATAPPAANAAAPIVVKNAADPATNPIAGAAYDFLDAVLKGDTQRASARLTPEAIERIIASGKQFAPPGLDTASFRIGEVRTPTESQAIVQCILTDASGQEPRSEEMCCLLKLVANEWKVSGIAYSPGPGRPPMILDFESPPQEPLSPGSPTAGTGGPANQVPASGRPSPPRTAQETPAAGYR